MINIIAFNTNKINDTKKIIMLKEETERIGKKYKEIIVKEINDFSKNIKLNMKLDVIIDINYLGKMK